MAELPSNATDSGTRPVPDPTTLTTEQLERAIMGLRELVFERIDRNTEVCDEKFVSVKTQLDLIERQRVEQKKDTKDAVDAALAAAKEAVKEQTTASERAIEKSETATIKSIEGLGEKFDTAFEGQRREVSDLKERIGVAGGEKRGGQEVERRSGDQQARALAGVASFIAFLSLVTTVVVLATN